MNGAELQRFHLFPILVQLTVRIDVDSDASLRTFFSELLEVLGAFAFRRVERDDVAELDDDRLLGGGAERDRACDERDDQSGSFHDAPLARRPFAREAVREGEK